jgi:poly-gamma-glutamate capsule biosynthesis protein CapA/YwtB (metallophosphatase superfamily)
MTPLTRVGPPRSASMMGIMNEITLVAVGDVVPEDHRMDAVAAELNAADITFGQLEEPLSNRGKQQLFAGIGGPRYDGGDVMDTAKKARQLVETGFDILSFATNHTMDRSEESLFDTIDAVRGAGIVLVGAGENIAAAREPQLVERDGVTVGFLAYCSVLPYGYQATSERPGTVPIRARTSYEQIDWRPGTKPRIHSEAYEEDVALMVADIEALRPKVDVLAISIHWGIHFEPATVAQYQREVGRAAIDAGADIVLGHHAHILKGVDVYKGKAIVYSLNNFSLRPRGDDGEWLGPDNTPSDQMFSVMAKATIRDGAIAQLSFVPVSVDGEARPSFVHPGDEYFEYICDYFTWATQEAGLSGEYDAEGGELVLRAYDRAAVTV